MNLGLSNTLLDPEHHADMKTLHQERSYVSHLRVEVVLPHIGYMHEVAGQIHNRFAGASKNRWKEWFKRERKRRGECSFVVAMKSPWLCKNLRTEPPLS